MIRLHQLRNPGLRRRFAPTLSQEQEARRMALPIATVAPPEATRELPYRLRRSRCYEITGRGGLWKWEQWNTDLTREPERGECYARQLVGKGWREVWVVKTYRRIL